MQRLLNWFRRAPRSSHPTTRQPQRQRPFLEELGVRDLLATALITPASSLLPNSLAFTPDQIRHAYGFDNITFPGGKVGDGSGQTIAIVDAYDNPNLLSTTDPSFAKSDLALFDQYFGLPDPPSFLKVAQDGTTHYPQPDANWETESALDVEWAHALAPKANLILVEADDDAANLYAAANYARTIPGVVVVSMSWSHNEFSTEISHDTSIFSTPPEHAGITFVAATGDNGAPGGYPAYSPNVLAVGGTVAKLDASGNIGSESGWSGSGGGISLFERQPASQNGIVNAFSTTRRTIPDVSLEAGGSGVWVYDSSDNTTVANSSSQGPLAPASGTSFATPAWAALIAIADQGRADAGLGALDGPTQTLPMIYRMPASYFNDVTIGNNDGYSAGPAYDLVTGRGTPKADQVVAYLARDLTLTGQGIQTPVSTSWSGVVSTFTDADPAEGAGNFLATIDWGDGKATLGTVTANAGGGFAVMGSHTYAQQGSFALTVRVADVGGSTATARSTAMVVAFQPGQLQLDASTYSVREDAGSITITVTRTNGSDGPATVAYATSDGSAHAGVNYTATRGELTFNAGQTIQTITLAVIDDHQIDGDKTVNLTLSNATGATLGSPATATLTVLDSDLPVVPNGPPPTNLLDAAGQFAHSVEHYTQFLTHAYAQYLKRVPDATGLAAWVSGMQAGTYSDEQVEALFLSSPEYLADHGGAGAAWITSMYQDLLGRTPSAAEVQGWVNVLNSGTSPYAVAYGFTDSQERETQRVVFNYQTYLGRQPRPDEISLWVNNFLSGVSNEDMVAGFVGSPEYYLDASKGNSNAARWIAQAYWDVLFRAASTAEINSWLNFLS